MNTEYTCYVQSEIKYRWANKKDFEVKLVKSRIVYFIPFGCN